MLLNKHRLNAERGLPSPLCTLPMHFYTLPIALSTGQKLPAPYGAGSFLQNGRMVMCLFMSIRLCTLSQGRWPVLCCCFRRF